MENECTLPATDNPATACPANASSGSENIPFQKKKKARPFVFEQHPSRKIALRLAYHGHVHNGLAIQKETDNTVEGLLCQALRRLRFVPEDGPKEMARCGRTDKGVSALSNCMSFVARSSCRPDDAVQCPPIDYATKLNHVLPSTIRVIGFAHVPEDFDARFSCKARTYRYYFCHKGLNLAAMQEAAGYLVGKHNFRSFCVLDVVNVSNFERHIEVAAIHPSEWLPECIAYLELKANSFLYHQVRCTMEVLFLVGRQLEPPSIVSSLLDCGDRKPQYGLADSMPLVLWECHFDAVDWQMTRQGFREVERQLKDISTALLIRATSAAAMRDQLFVWYAGHRCCLQQGNSASPEYLIPPHQAASEEGTGEVDEWGATGCDWTQPRSDELRKARSSCLLKMERERRDRGATQWRGETTERPGEHSAIVEVTRQRCKGYLPLLSRPTERTFEEQVEQLSSVKRARYEENAKLKAAGKVEKEGKKN